MKKMSIVDGEDVKDVEDYFLSSIVYLIFSHIFNEQV